MAEQEPTPEQLAAIAAENEAAEGVNYKAPAQKSLQEIQELDNKCMCTYVCESVEESVLKGSLCVCVMC